MTAVADLDRETQDRYELVVKATDMAGQMGGLSGSTTVTIVITDVNDNPPRFPQSEFVLHILLPWTLKEMAMWRRKTKQLEMTGGLLPEQKNKSIIKTPNVSCKPAVHLIVVA